MTPVQAIGMLDRQIAAHGQPVTLVRQVVNGDPIEWPARAFVRGYRADELTGEITVGATLIIFSPSKLAGGPFAGGIQRRTDGVKVFDAYRKITVCDPVMIGGVIVRWNLTVE